MNNIMKVDTSPLKELAAQANQQSVDIIVAVYAFEFFLQTLFALFSAAPFFVGVYKFLF